MLARSLSVIDEKKMTPATFDNIKEKRFHVRVLLDNKYQILGKSYHQK